MTKEREALKLALGFVESINLGSRSASVEQQREVIAICKEALAQPSDSVEKPIDFELAYGEIYKDQRAALAKSLAQPAQEPVAFEEWLSKQHGDPEEIGFLQALRIAYISGQDSIITPPQRTWVEPTGNEWFEWWRISKVADATEAEIDFADFLIIAQAVSAKLKERK